LRQQAQFEIGAAIARGTISSYRDRGKLESPTIRKLQIRLLPFLFILYVISFVDRINIGFAALTINKELAMTSQQFGFAAGVFFFGYCLFEVPSNLLLHKIGARIWIARILISWRILDSDRIRPHNPSALLAAVLAGPGGSWLLPRHRSIPHLLVSARERAGAIALFVTALPVTSIFGAPISGLVLDHVHWLGAGSWRWLLILEGLPAVLFGVLTYVVLPNRPAEAKFLTSEEKEWLDASLLCEERKKLEQRHYSVVQVLLDRRVLCLGMIELGIVTCSYTFSFWAPQLIKSLSNEYSNTRVGVLVMIPYLVGAVVMVLVSRSSDRNLERRYHAAMPVMLGGIALLLMGIFHSPVATVVFLSLLAIGAYSWCAPFFSLPCEFLTGIGGGGRCRVDQLHRQHWGVRWAVRDWSRKRSGGWDLRRLCASRDSYAAVRNRFDATTAIECVANATSAIRWEQASDLTNVLIAGFRPV